MKHYYNEALFSFLIQEWQKDNFLIYKKVHDKTIKHLEYKILCYQKKIDKFENIHEYVNSNLYKLGLMSLLNKKRNKDNNFLKILKKYKNLINRKIKIKIKKWNNGIKLFKNGIKRAKEINATQKLIKLENILIQNIELIVRGMLFKKGYQRYEDVDDLIQHANFECFKAMKNFNSSRGKSFALFNMVTDISLLNYTTRKQKHRGHEDIDAHWDLHTSKQSISSLFWDDLKNDLYELVFEKMKEHKTFSKIKKYITLSTLLVKYLKQREKFIKQNDFCDFIRNYGFKYNHCREYLNFLKEHRTDIMGGMSCYVYE